MPAMDDWLAELLVVGGREGSVVDVLEIRPSYFLLAHDQGLIEVVFDVHRLMKHYRITEKGLEFINAHQDINKADC